LARKPVSYNMRIGVSHVVVGDRFLQGSGPALSVSGAWQAFRCA
jgi:hypothetical protein